MSEQADRLAACWECARPQPLNNGQCEVEGCDGWVVYVDGDHPPPFSEFEMEMFRRLADRLAAGRIKGDAHPTVRKIAAAALVGSEVTLTPQECHDLVEILHRRVEVPRDGDEVRWWADLEDEARANAEREDPS